MSNTNQNLSYRHIALKRCLHETLLIAMLQFIGLITSNFLATPTLIWLGSGTACAFIFLRGYYVLPGVIVGTLLACLSSSKTLTTTLLLTTTLSLQTIVLFYVTQRYITPTPVFYKRSQFLLFVSLCAVISLPAAMMTIPLTISHFLLNWIANLNGILIIVMTFTALDAYFPAFQNRFSLLALLRFNYFNVLVFIFTLSFFTNLMIYIGMTMPHPEILGLGLTTLSTLLLYCAIKQ